jgi:hypothetical protein
VYSYSSVIFVPPACGCSDLDLGLLGAPAQHFTDNAGRKPAALADGMKSRTPILAFVDPFTEFVSIEDLSSFARVVTALRPDASCSRVVAGGRFSTSGAIRS